MDLLRQNTAVTEKLGPFLSSTTAAPLTSLTIARADVLLSKNAGTLTQKANTSNATHDAVGEYAVNFDAADVDTLGKLKINISMAGALPVYKTYSVVPQAVYDALVLDTAKLPVNITQIDGSAAAAVLWRQSVETMIVFTVQAGSSATNIITDLTETETNNYQGRVGIMLATSDLAMQGFTIETYNGTSKALGVTSMTSDPTTGDLGIIV